MSIYAYIDGNNLYKGVCSSGWNLDYGKFYIWLKEKYKVDKVFLFLGFLKSNSDLYNKLVEFGYILKFKEVNQIKSETKGNCDAEIILSLVTDYFEIDFLEQVLVSGDGDFSCAINFLVAKSKKPTIIATSNERCSIFLKKCGVKLVFIQDFKEVLRRFPKNEKAPDEHKNSQGSFS